MLVASVLVSFLLGRFDIGVLELLRLLAVPFTGPHAGVADSTATVVYSVRVPRIGAAVLVGAALAVSGSAYQGLFRNPMVSPDILGTAAGAGLGATLAILADMPPLAIQFAAFVCGLLAVGLTWTIAATVARGTHAALVLVLSGMVVASLFMACISIAKYLADPFAKLPAITFWLMGGLASVGLGDLRLALLPAVVGFIPLVLLRWRINVLSFGEEEARALGIDTTRLRLAVVVCTTLLTSAAVSLAGMVGWVGLVVPHLARMLVGPDYRQLLPASLLLGGVFMLGVDNVARTAFAMEIPLGILTSLVGAPFFIALLLRGKLHWA